MKYSYTLLKVLVLFFLPLHIYSQTYSENYVLSRTYRNKDGKVKLPVINSKYWGDANQVQTQISYFDGLGKGIQTISVFGAPDKRDLVIKTEYDNMYRPSKNYLPVPQNTQTGGIHTSISDAYYKDANKVTDTTYAIWTRTIYDGSPLSRVKEQKAPGVSAGVRKAYKVAGVDVIKRYWINSSDALEQTANYASGELSYVETKDEDDKQVEEFADRNGRVVARRVAGSMITYYVYDAKAQLRYVLQPAYQDASGTQSENLDLFAFQYSYDAKGLMVSKRIPGQGETIKMEYNGRNLLAFITDAKAQRFYYKYDSLNRQKEMGIVLGWAPDQQGVPTGGTENALIQSYYNTYASVHSDYSFDDELELADSTSSFLGNPKLDNKKGLLSWTRTRVLNADGTFNANDSWLVNVFYYDKKGRLVQTFRQLYNVGGAAFEKTCYQLDFVGNTVEVRTTQNTSSGAFKLIKKYTYDHQDRLLTIKHTFKSKVGNDSINLPEYTHVSNSYNEVGLPGKKELHDGVQKQNYKYTPRSWMASTTNDGGKTYSVTLDYNNNGNINALAWQTPGTGNSGNLANIVYDAANRFEGTTGGTLEEYGIEYDKNGNIKKLKRGTIDDLTYTYTGNVLTKVTDTKNYEGFDNGASGDSTDYYYDTNGNLIRDRNKKISSINYNLLNLPGEVNLTGTTRTVQYYYDASGAKLKTAHPSGTTLYAGAFEYNASGALQRIALEEGQLIKNGNSYEVNYYLKDHLGNVRMVLKQNGDVLQETQYYPFGLAVTKTGTDAQNKYLYNGKEKQPETAWLDYGARMYMREIGRWGVIDPLTDDQEDWNPYHYAYNSPAKYVDLYGLSPSNTWQNDAIAICPTCPKDSKYDDYRESKNLYTYDKSSGIVLNGDGQGVVIKGRRNQESTFTGWEHAIGIGIMLPAIEIPKAWLGKVTVGEASRVTTPISYISNKLAESEMLHKIKGYSNVMSKRYYTHSRIINGRMVRMKTNLIGRYIGRWLGYGLSRASVAVTVYDFIDTASTNFQNMSLEEQSRLLQSGQMSGSFVPNDLLKNQQQIIKSSSEGY